MTLPGRDPDRQHDDEHRDQQRAANYAACEQAAELGVDIYPIPQLSREISPVYDTLAVWRLASLIRRSGRCSSSSVDGLTR